MGNLDSMPTPEKKENPFKEKLKSTLKMMTLIAAVSMPLAAEKQDNEPVEPEGDKITLEIKGKVNLPSPEELSMGSDVMYELMRNEAINQGMEKAEVEKMMAENAQEDSASWVETVN